MTTLSLKSYQQAALDTLVVYGDACRLGEVRPKRTNVTVKYIATDVKTQ